MFVSLNQILNICYELTIFILFGILLYKIIKVAALPLIYGIIKQAKERSRSLRNKQNLTHLTIHHIDEKIQKQKDSFDKIEKKIQIWHRALLTHKNNVKEINKKLIEKIRIKQEAQNQQLYIEKIQEEVVPKAVELARKEFEEYSKKEGQHLLTKLILQLEKKIAS
ncbi:hypothetical protein KAW80_03425 [Candidatus Babeliales bacterium]|nr:hypothetical protein [Candidatus Babeliales bacterium]